MKKIKSRKLRTRNNKLYKYLMSLVVVVFVFYCSSYVDASLNDSVIEKNRVEDVYAVAEIDGIKRIFYLNMYEMNGRVSYCIDLGVDITTSIYHSTNDFKISYLSEEQIEYIKTISYFGYKYEGHDDYRYYMAAQELIWEYLGNTEIEWTNELNVEGDRINIDMYIDDILKLRDLDNRELNLNWKDSQTYKVGQELVLTDDSKILDEYEIFSSNYSDVSIKNNNLVIKVGNVIGEEKIELKKREYYDYNSLFYYYDTSQRLISSGNYRESDEILKFNIEGVSLEVQVIDMNSGVARPMGQASFEGAIYEIYNENDNLIGTYSTNEKGYFKVEGLLLGNYYIKQIKASKGCLVNNYIEKFEIKDITNQIRIRQQVITNNIAINKVFGSNGHYEPESKISFLIYNAFGRVQSRVTTNNDGSIFINLPYGVYTVKQVNTTMGYSMVPDFIIDVSEKKDGYVYYNLVNELISAKVKVISLDVNSGDNITMDGFSYKVRKKDEEEYLEYMGSDLFTTNVNGEVLIPIMLEYGDYILEQVSVPKGILLNDNEVEFSINDTSNLSLVGDNLVMDVNVYNEFVMGSVEVLALEENFYKEFNNYWYDNVLRKEIEYSLVALERIDVNGKVMYEKGDEVYVGLTDDDGKLIIDNLYLGSYCLIDKDTLEQDCFTLDAIDNKTKVVVLSLEFIKPLSKGDIIIQNMSNSGEAISGSLFEVIDNQDMIIYTGVTNDEGIIKVDGILVGNYCIRQREGTSNYLKLDNEICFFLDDMEKVEVINDSIINEIIDVPNTLSYDIGSYEIFIILVTIGICYFVYKKIFFANLLH